MTIPPAVVCAVAAALLAVSSPAPAPSWTRLGFDGGDVRALVADPGDPGTLFAGLAAGGVYRSTDGAATWRPVNVGLPDDFGEVRALAVDPSDSAVVYVATAKAVFRSADSGASWVLAGGAADWDVRALAVAAVPSGTLFVACGPAGLAASAAGGPLVARSLGVPEVVSVAVEPGNAWKVYAGTCGQGLLRSTDGGETFEPRGERPPVCLAGLALGPEPGSVYAATTRGVVRSADAGRTWTFEQGCLECVRAHAVAPDPAGGSRVLASRTVWSEASHPSGALDGLFASNDGGGEFEPLLAFRHDGARTGAIVFDAAEPAVVYAATERKGVLKSFDGGRHWQPSNGGLTAAGARVIALGGEAPGTVLVGSDSGAVRRTRDRGETWETLHDGIENAGVVALVADPTTPGTLLAGTAGSGVLRSDDGGATWAPTNVGLDHLWLADLAADPFEEGRYVAATRLLELMGGGILFFESTDGGASWRRIPDLLSVYNADFTFDPYTLGHVLCACGFAVSESFDGGRTFHGVANSPEWAVTNFVFDPRHPGVVFAGDRDGFLRSDDGGSTWQRIGAGPTGSDGEPQRVTSLALTATPRESLYAGTAAGAAFASHDGGGSWEPLAGGLPTAWVDALAVDGSGRVLVAFAGAGLFAFDPLPPAAGRPVRRRLSHPAATAAAPAPPSPLR